MRYRVCGTLLCVVALLVGGVGSAGAGSGADIGVELAVVDDLGHPQRFAVTVTDHGPADATYPTLLLDVGDQVISGHDADPVPGSRVDGVGCDQPRPGRLACSWDALGVGESLTFTVDVEVAGPDRLTATLESAGTPDPNPQVNNTDSLLLRPAEADVAVRTDRPEVVEGGDGQAPATVAVPVTVVHQQGRPAEVVLDVRPSGVVPVLGGQDGACDPVGEGWRCPLGELEEGTDVDLVVRVAVPEPGEEAVRVELEARATSLPDPVPADNLAAVLVEARATAPADIRRHLGAERIATAIAVSTAMHPEGGRSAAVLARADDFADALAGAPLAAAVDGPILLTATDQLPDATAEELRRLLRPGATVHLLGGEAAIGRAAADGVAALGFTVRRHAGPNRYATSAAIADALPGAHEIAYADGDTFPDAVVAAAAMAARGGAVLLTSGSRLPSETAGEAGRADWAIGRAAARAVPHLPELAGTTPAETAVVVASRLFEDPDTVVVATDRAFADALAGGPLSARLQAPILLTDPQALPDAVVGYLQPAVGIHGAHLLGGVGAVSSAVESQLAELLAR